MTLADIPPPPMGLDQRALGWFVLACLAWGAVVWILRRHKPRKAARKRRTWLGGSATTRRSGTQPARRSRPTSPANRGNPEPPPKREPFVLSLLHEMTDGMKTEAEKIKAQRKTEKEVRTRTSRQKRDRNSSTNP